jgi:hypothetical protein
VSVEGTLSRSDLEMAKAILTNETPDPMGIFSFFSHLTFFSVYFSCDTQQV